MPLISVIIPVYKVEPYLRRCLGSVLSQTFTGWECIIVDDGSPDGCPAICDEYAAKDSRFAVIHQENRGTAHARDAGIKQAKGEFILFSDGDDWLEPEALEALYANQRETGADVVIGGIKKIYRSRIRYCNFPKTAFRRDEDVLVYYFLNSCSACWGKLYRKELFDGFFVPSINIGEDGIVNVQIFSKLKKEKLQIVDKPVYNYDRRTNGIILLSRGKYAGILYAGYPGIACRLWTENFLKKTNQPSSVMAAFDCSMIREGVIPYLQENPHVEKETIALFYKRYYRPCPYLGTLPFVFRIIIPLLYHFNFLGTCYVVVLNAAIWLFKKFFGY
jgi:glycosyltransferase involved in cell wall biosynthesis